jgi:hypothetical protein
MNVDMQGYFRGQSVVGSRLMHTCPRAVVFPSISAMGEF